MTRYWVIAPYANNELYETVWNFNISNRCISIGWPATGDISGLDKDQIVERLRQVYPERSDQSYDTADSGVIDILAIDRNSKDFIVIELKRRRTSDVAIGQVLRYMGWVRATLCQGDNATRRVRGMIICAEEDQKLKYAHSMVPDVEIRYYALSFKLLDRPE